MSEAKLTLSQLQEGTESVIKKITAQDEELVSFLFSLGCYSGEKITVIAKKKHSMTVSIKDARYNMDMNLADAIEV